ncbi:gamma-glutamylcyclotransferase [Cupriavidus sp. CP313]
MTLPIRSNEELIPLDTFLDASASIPDDMAWPLARIQQSLDQTMQARTPESDVCVFAAGSLIWNPGFSYAQRRVATLEGWRRSFCLRLIAGRATPEAPGRMLALEPGCMAVIFTSAHHPLKPW